MERLTKSYSDGTHGAADTLPCGENSHEYKRLLLEALGNYEDLEAHGNLVKLPCNVGDSVYLLKGDRIMEIDVYEIHIWLSKRIIFKTIKPFDTPNGCLAYTCEFSSDDIGETVFLTREEAEAKLKELEESNER